MRAPAYHEVTKGTKSSVNYKCHDEGTRNSWSTQSSSQQFLIGELESKEMS